MAAHSEIIGKEVYVWMNGHLLYKKWLNTNQSALFTVNPSFTYDRSTYVSITDNGSVNNLTGEHKPLKALT